MREHNIHQSIMIFVCNIALGNMCLSQDNCSNCVYSDDTCYRNGPEIYDETIDGRIIDIIKKICHLHKECYDCPYDDPRNEVCKQNKILIGCYLHKA